MCGINGIFAYHYAANPVDRGELARTRDHMAARGPDGFGDWFSTDGRIGFGHRRLSIIDLSAAGAQPMASPDGSLVVTFNGEIYNYLELRRALEAKGRTFASNSDTEVLLHLYALEGEDMVHRLRGMFAFSIWDTQRRRLFLARDPYGIKPLYYADDGWTFRFASQVKALLAGGAIARNPEPAGLVGFYLWGSVPEPHTIYAAIRSLPAGSTMTVDRIGSAAPKPYTSVAAAYAVPTDLGRPADAVAIEARLRAELLTSVRCHLVADVPVGAFLSAGVDSGAIVGMMRDAGVADIKTVTVAFEEFRGGSRDEAPLAGDIARAYGTSHETRIVTRTEFECDLPRIVDAMDQPSIDGINTWFVAKATRERGLKVALSGLGGDELLGGYPSFRDIPRWTTLFGVPSRIPLVSALLGKTARHLISPLSTALGLNPKAAGLLEFGGTYAGAYLLKRGLFLPWELGDVLDPTTAAAGLRRLAPLEAIDRTLQPRPTTSFGRVATLESSLYMRNQLLRDTDWASMAHSLEVRVPLVDHHLLQQFAPHASLLADGRGKRILATAPSRALPATILDRPKTGFSTPVDQWMKSLVTPAQLPAASARKPDLPWARRWSAYVAKSALATG